jgi:hypothetical protein
MKNKEFISYFETVGISVISNDIFKDSKLKLLLSYLSNRSIEIGNFNTSIKTIPNVNIKYVDNDILKILEKYKNEKIFISIPFNEWV